MRKVTVPKSFLSQFTSRSAAAIALYLTLHLLTGGFVTTAYASQAALSSTGTFASITVGENVHVQHHICLPATQTVGVTSSYAPFSVKASDTEAIRVWNFDSTGNLTTTTDSLSEVVSPRAP